MLAIVDYQMGNLRSVQKGFEKVGHAAYITSAAEELRKADKIVLPGVGAFADAIAELRRRELVEPIVEAIRAGKPFLGICLGLQMLFEVGYEDGRHAGLGVVPGEVVRFDFKAAQGEDSNAGAVPLKIPHMGWNRIAIRRRPPILAGIDDGAYFYFVHSYYVMPCELAVIACETSYPVPFCSMIWRDNLFATQFHPEKSQRDGLRLLQNFAEL